jgi:hypothetical protein
LQDERPIRLEERGVIPVPQPQKSNRKSRAEGCVFNTNNVRTNISPLNPDIASKVHGFIGPKRRDKTRRIRQIESALNSKYF